MKGFLKIAGAVLIVLFLFLYSLRFIPIHVYDGFASSSLSWLRWSSYRFAPGAVTPEQSVVRSGRQALAITVHSGDIYEAASEEGAATERAELMESWWLVSRASRTYTYSFSLFIPKDIPQSSERLVIAQVEATLLALSSRQSAHRHSPRQRTPPDYAHRPSQPLRPLSRRRRRPRPLARLPLRNQIRKRQKWKHRRHSRRPRHPSLPGPDAISPSPRLFAGESSDLFQNRPLSRRAPRDAVDHLSRRVPERRMPIPGLPLIEPMNREQQLRAPPHSPWFNVVLCDPVNPVVVKCYFAEN